jgi:hypothetical protein
MQTAMLFSAAAATIELIWGESIVRLFLVYVVCRSKSMGRDLEKSSDQT